MRSRWLQTLTLVAALGLIVPVVLLDLRPIKDTRGDGKKQLYTCSMHPQVILDHDGPCPICHMPLTPLRTDATAAVAKSGSDPHQAGPDVHIDPTVVQNMGVRTAEVTRGSLTHTIRAAGTLKLPEPALHDISLKIGGWVEKLYANQEGMHVHEGDPLFELYSPELQVAAEELLGAVRAQRAAGANAGEAIKRESASLVDSARRKLRLWDVSDQEIDAMIAAGKPPRTILFRSPATGHLEEKMVVQGASVQPGMKLLRIADHTKLWLEAQVYEEQVPLLALGQKLEATVDALPGETFAGPITFIAPHIDPATRTIMVRATMENPDLELKPGMFAAARIVARRGDAAVLVPREAVIDTGTRQVAFVEKGQGHFEARLVHIGRTGDDDQVEVVDGLTPGETVVTSGQFLMDVESRTVEAIQKLRAPTTRPAGSGSSLLVVYCGMEKADWLQAGDTVANPYSGSKMPDCGEVKRHIRNPKDDPQLAELVRAYLAEQAALASDHIDPKVTGTLKSAAASIRGDRADSLRESIEKLSATTDLKDARAQFKTVSERLIRLLEEPGR